MWKKKACSFKCCVITPSEMWNIENKNKHIVFILEIKWRPQSQDLRNSWDSSPLTGQSQSSCLLLGLHRHLILHKWVFQTPPAEEIPKYICNAETLPVSRASFPHTQLREAGAEPLTLSETQLQSGDPAVRMVMLKAETWCCLGFWCRLALLSSQNEGD